MNDIDKVIEILNNNPNLLSLRGNVISSQKQMVNNISAYECALGEFNGPLATIIREFFKKIKNGREIRREQSLSHIKGSYKFI